ncbi:hypothetical protein HA402_011014 [Bradysia odoriphaga]|nr:hypothetical protein HA402_011014 [Bradysia odoriphaga]
MTQISPVDLELKRAFTEMQVNKIETTKKLKMLDLQMDVLKTSKKKYAITSTEVTELTPDASVFSSVGRMFVLSTVPDICQELKTKEEKCENLVSQLDEKKLFLIKCLKEQEDNLRELVQQRKEADPK